MKRSEALQLLADGLAGAANAVVARVWTIGPGDQCDACPMRAECPDQTECLHLVSSAGISRRTDGAFSRFPLGAREVGEVPRTREPMVVNDDVAGLGLSDATWLMLHDVRAFAAVPLAHGDTCIGVAAVFARERITDERLESLQAFATLATAMATGAQPTPAPAPVREPTQPTEGIAYLRPFDATERDVLERVLEHTRGRVSGPKGAAKLLGVKPTTLHSRMKKLGVARRAR